MVSVKSITETGGLRKMEVTQIGSVAGWSEKKITLTNIRIDEEDGEQSLSDQISDSDFYSQILFTYNIDEIISISLIDEPLEA